MVRIEDVMEVIKPSDGWFEPNMPSKQYIFDIRLKSHPYIVVRFITGINKTTNTSNRDGKVMAINLIDRQGFVKSEPIKYFGNWRNYLLITCRKCWAKSIKRVKRENLTIMTLQEFENCYENARLDDKI